ncbi:C3HC4 zinc finger domain-containing protein 2 [Elsinoe australis]|uniref:C3HC4 zinc finger domain-containing protein 2 n=1 Tax=Elsinoe australis TaxID=40998 RepID=A0A4V6DUR6_9PEZI|nr:C3HC4 zinc finger domain-containing protein 2 [Elsinoe australis]
MGTLTGTTVRLTAYCDHKLPTSCRLTSLRNCCACADERAHSPTYTTYIDGVGLVPRGRRWDRYCWFCKEFWNNRVAATNLLPSQTRIPEVPDQTEFLNKWYEFHQGYRNIQKEDGSEERIAVLGEPWQDVSPGHLPRTLDELRSGAQRSAADQQQHITIDPTNTNDGPSLEDTFAQLLEEAEQEESLPQRDEGSTEQAQGRNEQTREVPSRPEDARPRNAGNVMQPTGSQQAQARRIASLRRELTRMRNGLERVVDALRDLGDVPEATGPTDQLAQLDRSLEQIVNRNSAEHEQHEDQLPGDRPIEERIQERSTYVNERRRRREEASNQIVQIDVHIERARALRNMVVDRAEQYSIDVLQAQHQLDRMRQERRSAENYRRVFGSREDMERDDWISPINQMFTRATERFRDAESARRENRTPPVWGPPPRMPQVNTVAQEVAHQGRIRDMQQDIEASDVAIQDLLQQYYRQNLHQLNANQDSTSGENRDRLTIGPSGAEIHSFPNGSRTLSSLLNQDQWFLAPDFPLNPADDPVIRNVEPPIIRARRFHGHPYGVGEDEERGLDADKTRPEPKSDEQMTLKMDCKVCYTQAADTACLPCGHLVMCRWCSEQHSPSLRHDRTTPADEAAKCPVCRKVVKKKVRVRMG